MGKLGKKARKFAKKNLQSVLRNKRKLKSKFKRKDSKRNNQDIGENEEVDATGPSNERNAAGVEFLDISLDAIFSDDESEVLGDDSDSDGFLSEDSSCEHVIGIDGETENSIEDSNCSSLSEQNRDMHAELLKKSKKLNKLKEKDPGFSKFLDSYDLESKQMEDEETSSDDEERLDGMLAKNDNNACPRAGKLLTSASVDSLCTMVKEQHSTPAFTCLINAYRVGLPQ